MVSSIDIKEKAKDIEKTYNLNDYEKIILSIKNSERIKKIWQTYSNKYKYANTISIDTILDLLLKFVSELDIEIVAV
jgi:hypothetical protein